MKRVAIIYRSFKKNSKITLINVLGMALGLVSAGIILGHVYQEFNYDQDQLNANKIYRVVQKDGESEQVYTFAPLAESLQSNFPEIENSVRLSFFYGYLACSTKENKFNENSVIFADPGFFEIFSFPLIKGNSKECLNSPNSIVISEKAAKKYFGNTNPMGENIRIGKDRVFNVTGVYKNFKTNSNFKGDLVLPLEKISKLTQIWIEPTWKRESEINTFILLTDKKYINSFSEKARNFIAKFIDDSKIELLFQPLSNIHVNKQFVWESTTQVNVRSLYVLLIVAFLTLSISIVNFLFLYIGTAGQRTTEIGVKKVCGAPRSVLFFEHFKEVTVLMIFSIAAAIIIYGLYQNVLSSDSSFLPKIEFFNYKLVFMLLGLAILVAFLAGVYPSVILSSQKPINLFNRNVSTKKGKFMLVNLLIIIQFTLCIALMTTTFMVHKQANYMAKHDTGFAKDELITIPLNMHVGNGIYNDKFDLFANELKKYPGIKNVSLSSSSPSLVDTDLDDIDWEGKQEGRKMYMNFESVSYNYFKTIGVEVIKGRSFSRDYPTDELNWDSRTCAFLLNESAIKEMGITDDPIGKRIELWGFKGLVIGVVKDYNFKSMHTAISPILYINDPFFLNEIVLRISPATMPATLKNIETVWNKFAGDYPLEIKPVNHQIAELYKNDQSLAKTLSVFSLLSILIASIGMFTLTVLSINKRIKEIGIRKVNGAKVSEIMAMLIKNYIKLVMIAFIFATPIAWFTINKWLEIYAYKAELSWWIFALTGLFTLVIVLITVGWKSWNAASKNPVEALRYE